MLADIPHQNFGELSAPYHQVLQMIDSSPKKYPETKKLTHV